MFTRRLVEASVVTTLVMSLLVTPVFAGNGNDEQQDSGDYSAYGYGYQHTGPPGQGVERPGWGYGDTNHTHIGPPGQSDERPGWGTGGETEQPSADPPEPVNEKPGRGNGDTNHTHTGPPGVKK